MTLEGRAAGRVHVELRHGRVGRHAVVDPGALEAAREHLVLGRLDHPLPREVRRGGERRGDGDRERDTGDPAWQEKRRRDEPDDEKTEGETAGRRPRPSQLRLDAHPERARDGVDARLVGELAEGKDQWERECDDGADRGGNERSRQAGGEPDDQPDEPQRKEVEPVAVVKSVVAPRGARERGDDEQAGDVGGGEERNERRRGPRSRSSGSRQGHEDDRRDRDRHDREVDGEVAEVVHEPLADLERVVAAPELPVGAERV